MQNLLDIPLNTRNIVGNSWKQRFETFATLLSPCKILQERLQDDFKLIGGKSQEIWLRKRIQIYKDIQRGSAKVTISVSNATLWTLKEEDLDL